MADLAQFTATMDEATAERIGERFTAVAEQQVGREIASDKDALHVLAWLCTDAGRAAFLDILRDEHKNAASIH